MCFFSAPPPPPPLHQERNGALTHRCVAARCRTLHRFSGSWEGGGRSPLPLSYEDSRAVSVGVCSRVAIGFSSTESSSFASSAKCVRIACICRRSGDWYSTLRNFAHCMTWKYTHVVRLSQMHKPESNAFVRIPAFCM